MTHRLIDLADIYLPRDLLPSAKYQADMMRSGLSGSLCVQGAIRASKEAAGYGGSVASELPRWLERSIGGFGQVEHEMSSAQRLLRGISHADLSSLSDANLRSLFGVFDRLTRNTQVIIAPLQGLIMASATHAHDSFGRQQWLQSCLPDFDALMGLGQSVWSASPFDEHTQYLVRDLVGEQSTSAFEALERATSARLRRGLYRELGGSRQVERLPPVTLHGAFTPEDDIEPSVGLSSEFLLVLVRYSPLTRHNRRCYELIAAFEAFLRQELNARMRLLHGEAWIHSVSSDYRSAWRRNFCKQHGREPELQGLTSVLLSYSDLGDVMALLLTFFADDDFLVRELELRFQLIKSIRNSTAHQRTLLAQDVVALQTALVEVGRVLVPHLK